MPGAVAPLAANLRDQFAIALPSFSAAIFNLRLPLVASCDLVIVSPLVRGAVQPAVAIHGFLVQGLCIRGAVQPAAATHVFLMQPL